jgi:hypothetical protein
VKGLPSTFEKSKEAAMSTTDDRSSDASGTPSVGTVDMRLEVVVIPVSDIDRAKEFYSRLGWRLDADFRLITASGASSSRRPARRARSSSART